MPFRFTCPHCQHTTLIEDRYVDQSGECAVCGKAITVRSDSEETLAPRNSASHKGFGGSVAVMAVLLTLAAMAALVAFVVAVMLMAVPATQMAQSSAAQTACAANLTRIGQAMLDYHAQHGRFPPAYIADENGIPKHSWRVLLLPYLGENATYQSYNQKVAWNDWENTYSVGQMPSVYHCRDDLNDAARETSYLIVNGPGMIFNDTNSASLSRHYRRPPEHDPARRSRRQHAVLAGAQRSRPPRPGNGPEHRHGPRDRQLSPRRRRARAHGRRQRPLPQRPHLPASDQRHADNRRRRRCGRSLELRGVKHVAVKHVFS